MADKGESTRKEGGVPFEDGAFKDIVERMISGCGEKVPRMMATCGCGGVQDDEEEPATDATRKA